MARQRLRKDWQVLVYKYWIQPTCVPEKVWETSRRMQALWNEFVDLLEAETAHPDTARPVLDRTPKDVFHPAMDAALRKAADRSGLNWECREFLFDRFRSAVQRAIHATVHGGQDAQVGTPQRRSRLTNIVIPHRYSQGGIPAANLLQARPRRSLRRFWTKPVPQQAYIDNSRKSKRLRYTEGFFGLDGERMTFRTMLHRPVPAEAFIKTVNLIGNHRGQIGWEWSIAIVCELPPSAVPESTGRTCGLDLGWRRFGSYLRIGMLVGHTGEVAELRLPLDMSSRPTRDFGRWIERSGRPNADRIYESWEEIREATSRADQSFESLKAEIARRAAGPEWPENLRNKFSAITELGQAALLQFQRELQEAEAGPEIRQLISAWRVNDARLRRRIHCARMRFGRRRHWLYQNLAAWLATNYDTISWEADLGIRKMSEDGSKKGRLRLADRNRRIAAIGEFRKILKHQALKRKMLLIDGRTAYSSTTCFTCGRRTPGGPDLILQCPNGHRFDQDTNAASWFLSRIDRQVSAASNLRQGGVHASVKQLEIPEILKSIIVPQTTERAVIPMESDAVITV
ncbi:MAG: transposase [Acidobacteria bacterium]|nr:transposase [Acidobacteriota bacterium]